jgi:hypothetical protein
MKTTFHDKLIAYLALISGLSISAVAVYYSVVGLTEIFAAAVMPIIIMGVTLEVSKLVATVWLKQNWKIAPVTIKVYLIAAVGVLMLITSMGIFGFLSRAHLDQYAPAGDIAAKIAVFDEKIKVQRDNIDSAKRALQQMDSQVDQLLGRTDNEKGAERAVQVRRQQARERESLQKEIAAAQQEISKLINERSPIAGQLRKVEAEVGPIKYIATFFYGTTDQTILEKAVAWMIIILIVVFDPLAVVLLLASQFSFQYFRNQRHAPPPMPVIPEPQVQEEIVPDTSPDTSTIIVQPEAQPKTDYEIKEPVQQPLPQATRLVPGIDPTGPVLYDSKKEKIDEPLYVQNEEQQESNFWSNTLANNTISPADYKKKIQEKRDQQVEEYAHLVKSKQMAMGDVPEEFFALVKARV